jgi:hypothetical protein
MHAACGCGDAAQRLLGTSGCFVCRTPVPALRRVLVPAPFATTAGRVDEPGGAPAPEDGWAPPLAVGALLDACAWPAAAASDSGSRESSGGGPGADADAADDTPWWVRRVLAAAGTVEAAVRPWLRAAEVNVRRLPGTGELLGDGAATAAPDATPEEAAAQARVAAAVAARVATETWAQRVAAAAEAVRGEARRLAVCSSPPLEAVLAVATDVRLGAPRDADADADADANDDDDDDDEA